MKTSRNFAVVCEKDYSAKFVVTWIMEILKGLMRSVFLKRIDFQYSYCKQWFLKMMLKHEGYNALVKFLSGDRADQNGCAFPLQMMPRLTRGSCRVYLQMPETS